MKTSHFANTLSARLFRIRGYTAILLLFFTGDPRLFGQSSSVANKSLDERIVAAIKYHNDKNAPPVEALDLRRLFYDESLRRDKIIRNLIDILNDPQSRDYTKGFAAYQLGVLHATEAVDRLVSNIRLSVPPSGHLTDDESPWRAAPAAQALISIGTPSIPSVIGNLAASDDPATLEVSLRVLNSIEKDRDIVRSRLQKALADQKDSRRQARLLAALKLL